VKITEYVGDCQYCPNQSPAQSKFFVFLRGGFSSPIFIFYELAVKSP